MIEYYKKQKEKRLRMRIKELESRKESTLKRYEKEIQDIDNRIANCNSKLAKIYEVREGC